MAFTNKISLFLLGCFLALAPDTARADHPATFGPVKVDGAFVIRLNIRLGYSPHSTVPWYAYFPHDGLVHSLPVVRRVPQLPPHAEQSGMTPRVVPFQQTSFSRAAGCFGPPPSYWDSPR